MGNISNNNAILLAGTKSDNQSSKTDNKVGSIEAFIGEGSLTEPNSEDINLVNSGINDSEIEVYDFSSNVSDVQDTDSSAVSGIAKGVQKTLADPLFELSDDSETQAKNVNGHELQDNESSISVDQIDMDHIYTNSEDLKNGTNAVQGNKEYFDEGKLIYNSETGLVSEVQDDGSVVPMGYANIDVDKNNQTSSNDSTTAHIENGDYVDSNGVDKEFRNLTEANNRANGAYIDNAVYTDPNGVDEEFRSLTEANNRANGASYSEKGDYIDPTGETITYSGAANYNTISASAKERQAVIQIPTGSTLVYDGAGIDNHTIMSSSSSVASLHYDNSSDRYQVYYGDKPQGIYLDPDRVAGGNGIAAINPFNNTRLEENNN